jgi:hypothetical protein
MKSLPWERFHPAYEDFTQTTGDEALYLLAHTGHERNLNRLLGKNPARYGTPDGKRG